MITERKLITKKDAVILVLIVIAALSAVIINNYSKMQGETAVICVDGEVVREFNLTEITEKTEIKLDNGIVITAENGKVFFSQSSCKDKICINSGELTKSGDVAACVPNKTVVTVNGTANGTDVITY